MMHTVAESKGLQSITPKTGSLKKRVQELGLITEGLSSTQKDVLELVTPTNPEAVKPGRLTDLAASIDLIASPEPATSSLMEMEWSQSQKAVEPIKSVLFVESDVEEIEEMEIEGEKKRKAENEEEDEIIFTGMTKPSLSKHVEEAPIVISDDEPVVQKKPDSGDELIARLPGPKKRKIEKKDVSKDIGIIDLTLSGTLFVFSLLITHIFHQKTTNPFI